MYDRWLSNGTWRWASLFSFSALQIPISEVQTGIAPTSPTSWSTKWDLLGPFQVGTREWGTDPLEQYGGFHSLRVNTSDSFDSSFASNGKIFWSTSVGSVFADSNSSNVDLTITFPDIDWQYLTAVNGWSASQYQTWARGSLITAGDRSQTYEIFTDAVLELWIDDDHYYGGDVLRFRRAPLMLDLLPGTHKVEIRLVRDVRSMGGIGEPKIKVRLEAKPIESGLVLVQDSVLVSDIVNGRMASPYGSVVARNAGNETIQLVTLESDQLNISLLSPKPLLLEPGQTRPISFSVGSKKGFADEVMFRTIYQCKGRSKIQQKTVLFRLQQRSLDEMQKVTYLHPSGIVSFAMMRPPPLAVNYPQSIAMGLPVLVNMHGAGVDADTQQAIHSLDGLAKFMAWYILPSGVTSWSGDDWHQWGWPDLERALNAIPQWIENSGWPGPGPDINRLLLVGHSNGGQGVWHGLLHHPDRLVAAAPISAYISISKYVPYLFWRETDPRRTAVAQAVLARYGNDLLLDNANKVPVHVQHGSADENVPVFQARRMIELAKEKGLDIEYNEVKGAGHWYNGVMTTPELQIFYTQHLLRRPFHSNIPERFKVLVANPADMESKFGFRVQHLVDPGQLGRMNVISSGSKILIETSNVMSFSIEAKRIKGNQVIVDGTEIKLTPEIKHLVYFTFDDESEIWKAAQNATLFDRHEKQLGSLDAILRTRGPFVICYHDPSSYGVAAQIARNLFQYFAADAVIIDTSERDSYEESNLISVGIADNLTQSTTASFPIQLARSTVSLTDSYGRQHKYTAQDHGLAAIFLRPLGVDRLELVVWGHDSRSLEAASRLVPMLTGAAQPDFVVMTLEALWRGLDGTLALGFFNSRWRISGSSFLL